MELIKYDTLVQHRFVKNEIISNIVCRIIVYIFIMVNYVDTINSIYNHIGNKSYNSLTIMMVALSLLFIYDIFVEINIRKKNNQNITIIVIVAVLLSFNVIYTSFISIIFTIISAGLSLKYIWSKSGVVNKKFIHYSLHYKKLPRSNNYTILVGASTPFVVSLDLSNEFWAMFACFAVCYLNSITANYNWSYQQYIKKSKLNKSILDNELKKYEKENGKIKVRKQNGI